jgi:hypothetical protein
MSGGAPDCPVRHTTAAFPNGHFGGWGYKYPQPSLFKVSKHSLLLIQYKSNTQHSKTQIKASDQIKVHNSTLVFLDFFILFLLSKPCKRSKRHQLCGGPCEGLSDPENQGRKLTRSKWPFERGKGLKETRSLWPPQRGVGLEEPNLGKTNYRVIRLICLWFVFRPLSRTRLYF